MSEDKAVIQSRGKKDILISIAIMVAAIGSVYEYQQATALLDEAVIFLTPVITETKDKIPEAKPLKKEPIKENNNRQNLKEFLDYIDKTNDKAKELVTYEGSVLSNIKGLPAVTEAIKPDPHIFEDGKIEIYDSQKGVIDVVDAKSSTSSDKPKQDVAEEAKPEDAPEAVTPMSEQEQAEAIAQQQIEKQVARDLQKAAETGDEAPVVLLPGMGVPSVADSKSEETIDLNQTVDETTTDMEKINRAMQQVEMLNIEGLVPQAETTVSAESAKLPQTNAEVRILGDDGADGGVINMLNQITHQ